MAGLPSRVGMLQVRPSLGHRAAELISEEKAVGSVGTEWGSRGGLTSPSCRAGQGWAGRGQRGLPSPASGVHDSRTACLGGCYFSK